MKNLLRINTQNFLGLIIFIFSLTGTIASLMLTIERIHYLSNPNANLLCSINSTFNCKSVMNSPEAEIFGFPNSLLGLIGYSIFITYGLFLMFKSKKYLINIIDYIYFSGSFIAFIFSHWLMYVSVFLIEALCIYCIISYISATNIFFSLFYLFLPQNSGKIKFKYLNKYTYSIFILLWYLIMFFIIYTQHQS